MLLTVEAQQQIWPEVDVAVCVQQYTGKTEQKLGRLGLEPQTPWMCAHTVNQMGYDGTMVKRSYARDEPYPGADLASHGLGSFKRT